MSRLIFVRHGQASFLSDDYDQLSDLGVQQAKHLGDHLAAQGLHFDALYVGPRKRQRGTADVVRESFTQADQACPPTRMLPQMDEHQVDQLVMHHLPTVLESRPQLSPLVESLKHTVEPAERSRRFQILFEAVASLWIDGLNLGIETWPDFQRRVNDGIDQIIAASGRGQTIAVFTSVGPTSLAIQRALRCTDEVALTTGWRIRNCSVTEFVFSGDRFTLDSFNGTPHLAPHQQTYR